MCARSTSQSLAELREAASFPAPQASAGPLLCPGPRLPLLWGFQETPSPRPLLVAGELSLECAWARKLLSFPLLYRTLQTHCTASYTLFLCSPPQQKSS